MFSRKINLKSIEFISKSYLSWSSWGPQTWSHKIAHTKPSLQMVWWGGGPSYTNQQPKFYKIHIQYRNISTDSYVCLQKHIYRNISTETYLQKHIYMVLLYLYMHLRFAPPEELRGEKIRTSQPQVEAQEVPAISSQEFLGISWDFIGISRDFIGICTKHI